MFKVINKLKSDKRGFTLTEALVTLVVLTIALALTSNLITMIIKNYRRVEYRWVAQTMAEYFTYSLSADSGLEALATADVADMMYDEPTVGDDGSFVFNSCPELGSIKYDETTHALTITPSDSYKDALSKGYIYYISFDEHLYRIHYSDLVDITNTTSTEPVLLTATKKPISDDIDLLDHKEMEAEVNMQFAIARSAGEYDTTTREEDFQTAESYLTSSLTANVSVKVVNKADHNLGSTADMNVSVYLNNFDSEDRICYIPGGSELSNAYVAGWTKNASGEILPGGPSSAEMTAAGVSEDHITHYANIIRYHSINTPTNLSDSTQNNETGVGIVLPICFFTSLTIGSDRQTQILQPLRDFRDDVLRGTAIGNWMIEKYYEWSPAMIELARKDPALKAAFMLVTEGLAAFATVAVE